MKIHSKVLAMVLCFLSGAEASMHNTGFHYNDFDKGQQYRALTDYQTFADYEAQNPQWARVAKKTKTLVFGAGHMTPSEALEYSRPFWKAPDSIKILLPGIVSHEGHRVIHWDETMKPDYVEDYLEPKLIKKLRLCQQFDVVVIEDYIPVYHPYLNLDVAQNAYDALKFGGMIVLYERALYDAERNLREAGFTDILRFQRDFFDFTSNRSCDFPVTIAYKPESKPSYYW